MDSFNNRTTNYGSINYYDTNNKLTRLPESNSNKYESINKKDYLRNKNIVANPFNNK